MFFIPGTILVLVTIYLRPQEIWPQLQSLPLLHLLLGAALMGLVVDLRLRIAKPVWAPHMKWAILFSVWQVVTVVAAGKGGGVGLLVDIFIPFALYLIIGHGTQTFRALNTIAAALLALGLFLAYVGIDQRHSPKGCFALNPGSNREGRFDGRECETPLDCRLNGPEPGAEYVCEHIGMAGTNAMSGRVRWRGVLADPNELALALAICLPFAFCFFEQRRSAARLALLSVALAMIGTCIVYTQSRGGQVVAAAVLGTYFVRRYGWRGGLIAALALSPILLLGGRSSEEAAQSSAERYECWWTGLHLFFANPVFGVGKGLFLDHHFLTAHNSYVLALAETGFVGYFLFSMLLYTALKIAWVGVRRSMRPAPAAAGGAETSAMAPVARAFSLTLLASLLGCFVGIFLLSFSYHYVLWTYLGLSGAFYQCMRTHDPSFEVKVGVREWILVLAADVMVMVMLYFYVRTKV